MAKDALAESDDDDALLEALAQKDAKQAKAAKQEAGAGRSAPHMALRIALGTSGLLLVIGFFLPWLSVEAVTSISGMDLVTEENPVIRGLVGADAQRYVLLLIPAFGLALTAVGFLGFRWSGQVGALLGVLLVGGGLVTVIIFFFQRTGPGLWMVLGGAFLAILAGAVTWARARPSRGGTKNTEITLPED